jgi:hypothetical protein
MTPPQPLLVAAIGYELRLFEDTGIEKYLNQWNELDREYERCIVELRSQKKER